MEDVEIFLEHSILFSPLPLHRFLLHAWGITYLTLHLPQRTCATVFQGVFLPDLRSFDTNLPHGVVKEFLGAHMTITRLQLRSPGCDPDAICPLHSVYLDGIDFLGCPFSCIPHIVGPIVTELEVRLYGTALLPSTMLRHAPERRSIERITADVVAHDYPFLATLACFAPSLVSLKLTEVNLVHQQVCAVFPL